MAGKVVGFDTDTPSPEQHDDGGLLPRLFASVLSVARARSKPRALEVGEPELPGLKGEG
jgi:hypothetical protein